MTTPSIFLSAPLLALCAFAHAQSTTPAQPPPAVLLAFATQPTLGPTPTYSTSLTDPVAIPESPMAFSARAAYPGAEPAGDAHYRPFLSYSASLRVGDGGIGGDIATPLLRRLDLRGGAEAFTYSTTFSTSGMNAAGTLKLGDSFAALDVHPFNGSFRLSPGIAIRSRNNVTSNLNVPAGGTITLNDTDYTSQLSNPITGTAVATFPNKLAPRLTLGWGKSFPRDGDHWSFPTEFGFYYTSKPKVAIAFTGSACSSQGCGSIDTPENEANILGEQVKLNNDLAVARFFPVISFGVGYRFGH